MKQKYYSNKRILESGAPYMLQLGERSNGKSYANKDYILRRAYSERDPYTGEPVADYQFAYIRRWAVEIKGSDVEQYFADLIFRDDGARPILDITDGNYDTIAVYRGGIYFAKTGEDGSVTRGKKIGNCFALTQDTHYKSLSFPQIGVAVFEEFITDSGYLHKETKKFFSVVSTIFRRRNAKIFLVGNTLSRACVYFREWSLDAVLHQDRGTIVIYRKETDQTDDDGNPITVDIAVEFCENSGNNSKIFFGSGAKMITRGDWDSETQPHLVGEVEDYQQINEILFDFDGLGYLAHLLRDPDGRSLVYVEPAPEMDEDEREARRVVTDKYSLNPRHSLTLLPNNFRYDMIYVNLIRGNKLAFSDDLTGTEFRALVAQHSIL